MTHDSRPAEPQQTISTPLTVLLAVSCAIVVANLYYAQPIVGILGHAYGLSLTLSGLLVTVTQLGYAIGLAFVVPLADIVENRKLILALLAALIVSLLVAMVAPTAAPFLAASLIIGIASCAVQVIVPFAGHLACDATRRRVVGNVVSGLLFGIMLSRPAASFAAHAFGARSIFALSAAATLLLALVLAWRLPRRQPHGMPYGEMLASLWPLLRDEKVLQRRSAYQAAMFGAFSLYWTAVPLLLAGPPFGFSQIGIGVFAFVGAGGALVSPLAGRAADAGYSRQVTALALVAGIASFLVGLVGAMAASWPILTLGAVLLDMAVAANLVTGQRAIFALGSEVRGRLNGLFLAIFFIGGAIGSTAAGVAYAHGGWMSASIVGLTFPLLAFAYFATEPREP